MSHCNHTRDESWWEHDARGIPLARVCVRCRAAKLRGYRPEVLTDPSYHADEDIEPEMPERSLCFLGLPEDEQKL